MKFLPIVCLLFLVACKSNVASESITHSVINDLNAHQQAIQTLDKQTTKECKTDVFVATLNSLKAQTDSIAGQVKSISEACNAEKQILKNELTAKNLMILMLVGILILILFLWVKIKR